MSSKQRCAHIYENLTMCTSKNLHAQSIYCIAHFDDLQAGSDESGIQNKRLDTLRKIRNDFIKLKKTFEQIKEVGFGIDYNGE